MTTTKAAGLATEAVVAGAALITVSASSASLVAAVAGEAINGHARLSRQCVGRDGESLRGQLT